MKAMASNPLLAVARWWCPSTPYPRPLKIGPMRGEVGVDEELYIF